MFHQRNLVTSANAKSTQRVRAKAAPIGTVVVLGTLVGFAAMARAQDCNNNGIPDSCDINCGAPGGPCDVAGCGTKQDCNGNGIPDDCELTVPHASLDFDGVDDYVRVPRTASLEPTTAITLEAWIRPDTNGSVHNRIMRIAGDFGSGYILACSQQGDARIQLRIDGASSGSVVAKDTVTLSSYFGQWTHVAGVYSVAGNYCKIYVNGVVKETQPAVGAMLYSGADLYIGNFIASSSEDFDGRIDEVRVWNIARTATEINTYKPKSAISTA